ncbi:MAG: serine hydrolase family protein [Candidatus Liptonbacteria bacterium]|nr:serine hydrolase family protein [Candidatus Liptonbacteria bacterium]
MKRLIIVHGWDGHPKANWFPWLKRELEKKGFEVLVPQLPDPGTPRIEKWVAKLAETVGTPDENTYFVGHSIGCATIAHYLEKLPEEVKVGGAIFVGGFFKELTNLSGPEEEKIAENWLKAPIDFQKVKSHLPKSIAIFSDDDPWVPLDNVDDFRDKLGSEIITKKGMGHFNEDAGFIELPIVLELILDMSKQA